MFLSFLSLRRISVMMLVAASSSSLPNRAEAQFGFPGGYPGGFPGGYPGGYPGGFPGGPPGGGMPGGGMGMPGGGMGMPGAGGGIMGMGMGMTAMVDVAAGSLATKIFNRAPSCKISIKSPKAKIPADGGDGMLEVEASGSCAWQAQSSVEWIQVTSGAGGSGSGVLTYTVKPAAGKSRSGSISIVAANGGSPIKGKASLVVTQSK